MFHAPAHRSTTAGQVEIARRETEEQQPPLSLRVAFIALDRAGMQPTWQGDHVVANVPGITVGAGGARVAHTTPEVVRSAQQAYRLIDACN